MVAGHVAIVGAGIGGLAAAIGLANAGVEEVHVFERAPKLRDTGGALILWCNALRALAALGVADVVQAPTAQVVDMAEFRRQDGEHLTRIPVGEIGERHGADTIVISRHDLLLKLREHAARVAEVRFDAGLVLLEQDATGVEATFADGSRNRFDLLIGADGLTSTVSEQLVRRRPLRETSQDLWVGTVEFPQGGSVPGNTIATVGDGCRFWHTLLGDGRMFWYAAIPTVGRGAAPRTIEELARVFARFHDPIPSLISATKADNAIRTAMRDRAPALPWGSGRVTLLGDAAHAMTPDLGQGACQAIESAVVLANRLRSDADVERALRRYERERFARTTDVIRLSWLVAQTSSASGPMLGGARDAAMRFGFRAAAMSQLDWLFAGAC